MMRWWWTWRLNVWRARLAEANERGVRKIARSISEGVVDPVAEAQARVVYYETRLGVPVAKMVSQRGRARGRK